MRGTRYYNDKTDTCSRVEKVESGPDDSRLIGQEMRTRHSDEENEEKKRKKEDDRPLHVNPYALS